MYLERVGIQHVRNLTNVEIEADPKINFFFGANATGKTAILEAIHLLARAKSFRSPRIRDIIQHKKPLLSVTAQLIADNQAVITTGLEKSSSETRLKFNGEKISRVSEQAQNIPLFVITPESHRILAGTPKDRRHWLDWAMFHVEPRYIDDWRDYHQALRHRNALLRKRADASQFVAWETVMADTALRLGEYRRTYLSRIQQHIIQKGVYEKVEIAQNPEPADGLLHRLSKQREIDMKIGYTQTGPHRADIVFSINGQEAGKILSRGEAKLFIVMLMSGQAIEYKDKTGNSPVMLVDDISAEFDEKRCIQAIDYLVSLNAQLFINSVLAETAERINSQFAMFHVEHGKVSKVVK
ncbi:MAG: DNA replication/repair protein RecF [Gammaproteobacteria bacterium]